MCENEQSSRKGRWKWHGLPMFKKLMTIAQTRLNNLNGPSFFPPFLNPFTRSASDCWRFSFYTMGNSLRPFILMLMLSTGHHIKFNTCTHFSVFQENKAHSCHSFCQSFKHKNYIYIIPSILCNIFLWRVTGNYSNLSLWT